MASLLWVWPSTVSTTGAMAEAQAAVVGQLEDGPAGGVERRDQRVVGEHRQQVQAVLVDGRVEAPA